MNLANNLRKLNDNLRTLFTEILFLSYNCLYYLNEFFFIYSIMPIMIAFILLIPVELYFAVTTITAAMHIFAISLAVILTAIIVYLVICFAAPNIIWGYYAINHDSAHIRADPRSFIDILAMLISSTVFMLVVGPPLISFILPVVAFILKPGYASILLANLIVTVPIFFSLYMRRTKSSADENRTSPHTNAATTHLKHHFMLQLELFVRTVITVAISAIVFTLLGPAFTILIAPYATYMLLTTSCIFLAITQLSGQDNILSVAALATIYAASTCYIITLYPVTFIIVPYLLSIILAAGAGIIGTKMLFHTIIFMANTIIDKGFKTDSTVTTLRNKYRSFVSSLDIPGYPRAPIPNIIEVEPEGVAAQTPPTPNRIEVESERVEAQTLAQ